MQTHELKTHPEPFQAVKLRTKTAEFRLDDRGFQIGDFLILLEYDPETKQYSGDSIEAEILHIAKGFGIPEGYCMISFAVVPPGYRKQATWNGVRQSSGGLSRMIAPEQSRKIYNWEAIFEEQAINIHVVSELDSLEAHMLGLDLLRFSDTVDADI